MRDMPTRPPRIPGLCNEPLDLPEQGISIRCRWANGHFYAYVNGTQYDHGVPAADIGWTVLPHGSLDVTPATKDIPAAYTAGRTALLARQAELRAAYERIETYLDIHKAQDREDVIAGLGSVIDGNVWLTYTDLRLVLDAVEVVR